VDEPSAGVKIYLAEPGVYAVPVAELRMRACYPIDAAVVPEPPLSRAVLESTTVVYAFVGGPYPEVPRAYPALYAFMGELGWVEDGPVREAYLVDPAAVAGFGELVTEVQIPATSGR